MKHRIKATVWVMGDVAGALRSLNQGHHTGGSAHVERPLASFSYQHAIVRSGATGGYSLLLHPETLQRLLAASRPHGQPLLLNTPFAQQPAQGGGRRAARGSGIGVSACGAPTVASALRTLRPVAVSARWSQALLLSVEGDVYQWRVTGGPLLNEEADTEGPGGGRAGSRGGSFTSIGTIPEAAADRCSTPPPASLAPPASASASQLAPLRSPHPRFFSVSDRVVVLAGGGAATEEATAASVGPQLLTPFCLLRALSGVRVVAVACGTLHCAALTFAPDCDVYTWGSGAGGRLGHGSEQDEPAPRLVEGLAPYRVTAVAAGAAHTAALTSGTLALLAQVRGTSMHARPGGVRPLRPSPRSAPPPLQEHRLKAAAKSRRARDASTGGGGDSLGAGGGRGGADWPDGGSTTQGDAGGGGRQGGPAATSAPAAAAGVRSGDDSAGAVWTWGSGQAGALGHGDLRDRTAPTRVRRIVRLEHRILAPSAWVDVSGGACAACVRKARASGDPCAHTLPLQRTMARGRCAPT